MCAQQKAVSVSGIFPASAEHINYLVNWSDTRKIIYTETPKVGCTVIKSMLQYTEFGYNALKLPEDVHDRTTSPLKRPRDNEKEFLKCIASDEYFKFSFVRNPFTRVLSAYLDKIIGRPGVITPIQKKMGINPFEYVPTFSEFIDIVCEQHPEDMDAHWAPQTFLLGFENIKYDYLGRFEFFTESIQELVTRTALKVPPGALSFGKEHATNASQLISEHYVEQTIRKVQDIYYDDFKHLGYGWSI